MNKIESYIDSVIPKNIPKPKQQKLRAEIEAHIFDRIDFYTDIGYDTAASIDKALADMGEDEEVKSSIRNDFEELHFEHLWHVMLTAFSPVVLNLLAYCLNSWTHCGLHATNEHPITSIHIICSFVLTLVAILIMIFCYKKGLRKSLIGICVSSCVSTAFLLFTLYTQLFFNTICTNACYLLDRFTPLVLKDFGNDSIVSILGPTAFGFVYGFVCVILSKIIKKNGKPKKTNNIITIIFSVFWCILAVFNAGAYETASDYFYEYPNWFGWGNDITQETDMLFGKLDNTMSYDDAINLLSSYGYVSTSEYEKTLDKNTAKKFRYNLEEYNFNLDENYDIFFNPSKTSSNELNSKQNEFVYLLKGEDGMVKIKGIGEIISAIVLGHDCSEVYDLEACVESFKEVKVGDSESQILKIFGTDYGHIYTKFTRYTEDGEDNYYRFHCFGGYEIENLYELLPGAHLGSSFQEGQVWIEFFFENGKVTDAKLHYFTTDDWYSIIPQVIELS